MLVLVRPLPPRHHRRPRLRLVPERAQQHQRRRRREQLGRRPGLPPRSPAMEVENSPPPVHQPVPFERVTVAPMHQDHPRLLLQQHLHLRLKSFIQQIALTTLQQGKHQQLHRHHQHHRHRHHPLRRVELVDSRPLLRHPDFGQTSHETLCGHFTCNPLDFNCCTINSVTNFRFFPPDLRLVIRNQNYGKNIVFIIYFIMVSKKSIVQIDKNTVYTLNSSL